MSPKFNAKARFAYGFKPDISCINRKIYPIRSNITFDGKIKKENIMMNKKNMGQI